MLDSYFNAASFIKLFAKNCNEANQGSLPILLSWEVIIRLCQVQLSLNEANLSLAFTEKQQSYHPFWNKLQLPYFTATVADHTYALGIRNPSSSLCFDNSFFLDVDFNGKDKSLEIARSKLVQAMHEFGFELHETGFWYYNPDDSLHPKLFNPQNVKVTLDKIKGQYCLINCSMLDGIGDLIHLSDFYVKLYEQYATTTFIPLIYLEDEQLSAEKTLQRQEEVANIMLEIQAEIKTPVPAFLFSVKSLYSTNQSRAPHLINIKSAKIGLANPALMDRLVVNTSRAIVISRVTHLFFNKLPPSVPCTFIAEHYLSYNTEFQKNWQSFILGLNDKIKNRIGKISKGIGIKIGKKTAKATKEETLLSFQQKAPEFYNCCLSHANNDIKQAAQIFFIKTYVYYDGFTRFCSYLIFLGRNHSLPKGDILIHFSTDQVAEMQTVLKDVPKNIQENLQKKQKNGYGYNSFFIELGDMLKKGNIHKIILDVCGQPLQAIFENPENDKGRKIIIAAGYRFAKKATYREFLSSMVEFKYDCGDNSFEDSVTEEVLPLFLFPSHWEKSGVLEDLPRIVKELHKQNKLEDAVKDYFLKIFNEGDAVIQLFRDRSECLDNVNIPEMRKAWPVVCDYIREHYNAYDKIPEIFDSLLAIPQEEATQNVAAP